MPVVMSNGTRINYEVSGNPDGPWLILSNSLGTDLAFWDGQAEAVNATHHILRYDTRGHGRSDAPAGDYTFDQLGGDVLALMDAIGIDTAAFCGLSMGGVTGLWLAVNAPERIERLILCNTGAKIGDESIWQPRIEAALSGGMDTMVEAIVDRWFTKRFQAEAPDTVDKVRAMILRTPGTGYAGNCAALRDCDLREAAKSITLPTLIIAGEHDPATPPALSDDLHAAIRGSELVVLDAAHLSNIEAETDFNAAVSDFLKAR